MKEFFKKWGIVLAAVLILVVGGSVILWMSSHNDHQKTVDKQIAAITAAAEKAGEAKGREEVNSAQQAEMANEIKQITAWQADASKQLSNIRSQATQEKSKIDNFDVKDVAVQHPEVVEKWANTTNNNLFTDIQKETQPEATQP